MSAEVGRAQRGKRGGWVESDGSREMRGVGGWALVIKEGGSGHEGGGAEKIQALSYFALLLFQLLSLHNFVSAGCV